MHAGRVSAIISSTQALPTIHKDIFVVRLNRQPFRTFGPLTNAERYLAARDTQSPPTFDPATLQAASDLLICTEGTYTSATTSVWGIQMRNMPKKIVHGLTLPPLAQSS